jgi:adenylate kinase family enzyme
VCIRLHVFGASGSGTTTLGRALHEALGLEHFDSDAFFWLPTEPPFTTPREKPERDAMALGELAGPADWVLSGSIVGWSPTIAALFSHAVFLRLPGDVRMARLRTREAERYGHRIEPGGDMCEASRAFLAWAERYDAAGLEQRSLATHRAWMSTLSVPVLELDEDLMVTERVERVQRFLSGGARPRTD